jgi:hypothetical protein
MQRAFSPLFSYEISFGLCIQIEYRVDVQDKLYPITVPESEGCFQEQSTHPSNSHWKLCIMCLRMRCQPQKPTFTWHIGCCYLVGFLSLLPSNHGWAWKHSERTYSYLGLTPDSRRTSNSSNIIPKVRETLAGLKDDVDHITFNNCPVIN